MADASNRNTIEWVLSLKDLASPEYRKAVQTFKEDVRKANGSAEEMDKAYKKLTRTMVDYKEKQLQAIRAGDDWGKAAERGARATDRASRSMGGFAQRTRLTVSALGRLPGALGQVGRSFGYLGMAVQGALGPIGSIAAVFAVAYTATRKLVDALNLFPDPMERVKLANEKAKMSADRAAEAFERQREKWVESLEKEAKYADRAIAKADAQAAAYLRLQKAKEAVNKAVNDGIMLEMQRAKYEDMVTAGGMYGQYKDADGKIRNGGPLEAAQVGAYHDVLIAQERQKRERERADREIELAEREIADKENTRKMAQETRDGKRKERLGEATNGFWEAKRKLDDAENALKKARDEFQDLDTDAATETTYLPVMNKWNPVEYVANFFTPQVGRDYKAKKSKIPQAEKKRNEAQREFDKAKAQLERLEDDRYSRGNNLETRDNELNELRERLKAQKQARENLDKQQKLEMSKIEDAYNKIILDDEKKTENEERAKWENDLRERAEAERALKEENDRIAQERAMQNLRERAAYEREEARRTSAEAESRLRSAQSQAAQAWGFYRDPSRLVAHGREMDADAAARERYAKDYRSLVHGRRASLLAEAQNAMREGGQERVEELFTDWRKRKRLSVNEEATMRVAVAEKEQEDAARAVVESRDILASIESKIDRLNTMEG